MKWNMPRFLTIDHSIKGKGGHYLEYVLNVSDAAKTKGYTPCVSVNKAFNETIRYECCKYFIYDIWGVPNKNSLLYRFVKNLYYRVFNAISMAKAKFSFSSIGYLWLLFKRRQYINLLENTNKLFFIIVIFLCPVLLVLYLFYLICKCLFLLVRLFAKLVSFFVQKILRTVQSRNLAAYRMRRKIITKFKKSLRKTLRHFKITTGDIVFIPTLSVADLEAALEFIKENKSAQRVTWHLVFRRNLFIGREPVYDKSDKLFSDYRRVLIKFSAIIQSNVFFYTDTEKLTEQYNLLNVAMFHTLPIPVNPEFLEANARKRELMFPLNVVYLGDARREKGYEQLLDIVEDLWQEYVLTGKVIFDLQSNFSFFNAKSNYDVVYCRNSLEALPSEYVKVRKNPLDTYEYVSFVKTSDIALLLFDRDNYYARSSGTLVECKQVAMPIIVPAASWLSEKIVVKNYQYLSELENKLTIIEKCKGDELTWKHKTGRDVNQMQDGELSVSNVENAIYVTLRTPLKATLLFVSFFTSKYMPIGSFVKTRICSYNKDGCFLGDFEYEDESPRKPHMKVRLLFNLPKDTYEIKLYFNSSLGNNILINDIDFVFALSESNNIPYGYSGLCYSRFEDVPVLLKNIIDNFIHYKDAAIYDSKQWQEHHNSNQLVSQIIQKSRSKEDIND